MARGWHSWRICLVIGGHLAERVEHDNLDLRKAYAWVPDLRYQAPRTRVLKCGPEST